MHQKIILTHKIHKNTLTKKIISEDADIPLTTPASPIVFRRNISREEGDVFSRLGAGQLDPTPGGSIRDFNGRVSVDMLNFVQSLFLG